MDKKLTKGCEFAFEYNRRLTKNIIAIYEDLADLKPLIEFIGKEIPDVNSFTPNQKQTLENVICAIISLEFEQRFPELIFSNDKYDIIGMDSFNDDKWYNEEMRFNQEYDHVKIDKGIYKRIPCGEREWVLENKLYCPDCGAPHGNSHFVGCDAEICPKCKGQLILCGCDILGLVKVINSQRIDKPLKHTY
jgi:hypothetical protein